MTRCGGRGVNLIRTETANLLSECEERFPAARYQRDIAVVPISSDGADVFVVSDLHLAAGKRDDGRYAGTENFFSDSSFHRFLIHAHESCERKKALLVINGDFIDFLRITEGPCTDEEYAAWQRVLEQIGILMPVEQLKASVTTREVKCDPPPGSKQMRRLRAMCGITPRGVGLKTHDFKSVWKIDAVANGHPLFFNALAEWVDLGHRLIIVKGNHDLEWYWLAVRNYMRLTLGERIARKQGGDFEANLNTALTDKVIPQVTFIDDGMVIDGNFYIEHGHRYDKYTRVLGAPILEEGNELNIPFGSFLNRYLLNFIELDYPFLDNVRPTRNVLPMLIRERFPLAMKLLLGHLPFAMKIIPKQYYDYMFRRVLITALAVGLPILLVAWQQRKTILSLLDAATYSSSDRFTDVALGFVMNFGWMLLSYVLARVVAYFQLEEPDSLAVFARKKLDQNPQYRFMTMGHTHNPDLVDHYGRCFYNTGTWIPIVESTSADLREDRTYTVLAMRQGADGFESGTLYRWDDEAGRMEEAIIINRNNHR